MNSFEVDLSKLNAKRVRLENVGSVSRPRGKLFHQIDKVRHQPRFIGIASIRNSNSTRIEKRGVSIRSFPLGRVLARKLIIFVGICSIAFTVSSDKAKREEILEASRRHDPVEIQNHTHII